APSPSGCRCHAEASARLLRHVQIRPTVRWLPVVSLRACKQTCRFLRLKQKEKGFSTPLPKRKRRLPTKRESIIRISASFDPSSVRLDTPQFTRLVVRPTSLCHHQYGNRRRLR